MRCARWRACQRRCAGGAEHAELPSRRRCSRPGGRASTGRSLEKTLEQRALLYDKSGEEHYNVISALHKSMRNSDADAALYWLARMLEAGEDPMYIARRLIRFASEDIGNADPQALSISVAAKDAVHFIGMPEGNTALAQAVLYLATAPKSNAVYMAYNGAAEAAKNDVAAPVPLHMRNAPTKLMKQLDYGKGYQYAHDEPDAVSRHGLPAGQPEGPRVLQTHATTGSRKRSRSGWLGGRAGDRNSRRLSPWNIWNALEPWNPCLLRHRLLRIEREAEDLALADARHHGDVLLAVKLIADRRRDPGLELVLP